jgi:hypothetical protein
VSRLLVGAPSASPSSFSAMRAASISARRPPRLLDWED